MRLFEHPDFDQVILQAAEHFQLRPAIIEKRYSVTDVLRIRSLRRAEIVMRGKWDSLTGATHIRFRVI